MKFEEIFAKRHYRILEEGNQLIRNQMIGRDLSMAKLASLAGISESYAEHLIRNDRKFREDELLKVLPLFQLTLSCDYFIPQNTIHGKFVNLPRKNSPELMQIIGYFLGDGNLQERSLRFKDTDKEVLKIYQKLIEKVFNVKGRIVPQKETIAYLLEVNSLYLRNWFQKNITVRKREILEEIKQLPQREFAAFLRGIFDAEGYVATQSRQIRLAITNQAIAKVLHYLLSRLGITLSFYKIKRKKPNWRDVYLISLNSYDSFEEFSKFIGFSSKEKVEKLLFLISKKAKKKIHQSSINLCVG